MKELSILKRYGWTDALIAEFEKSLDADTMLRSGHARGTAVTEVNAANLFVPAMGPSSSAGTAVFMSQSTAGSLEAK